MGGFAHFVQQLFIVHSALQSSAQKTDIDVTVSTLKELWYGRNYGPYTSNLHTHQEQNASGFTAAGGHVGLHLKGTRKDFLKDE